MQSGYRMPWRGDAEFRFNMPTARKIKKRPKDPLVKSSFPAVSLVVGLWDRSFPPSNSRVTFLHAFGSIFPLTVTIRPKTSWERRTNAPLHSSPNKHAPAVCLTNRIVKNTTGPLMLQSGVTATLPSYYTVQRYNDTILVSPFAGNNRSYL